MKALIEVWDQNGRGFDQSGRLKDAGMWSFVTDS